MGDSPSSAGERWRRILSTSCRLGPRPLICRRSPLTIRTRPAHSRSPTPTACAAFWKERASGRSRLLPVTSRLEAVTWIRCWRFVRVSELWARFFGKIPSSGPRRYRQCDRRLRHTMDGALAKKSSASGRPDLSLELLQKVQVVAVRILQTDHAGAPGLILRRAIEFHAGCA